MKRHLLAALLLAVVPLAARAQEAPERLLSAETQVYVRWDGLDAHRAAFDKTALSKVLQGDLGEMIAGLLGDKKEHALTKLAKAVGKQGMIVGVEVRSMQPPQVELMVILPSNKTQWEPLFTSMTWIADSTGNKVEEKEIANRTVYEFTAGGPVHLAFWKEAKEAVLVIGTDGPEAVIKRLDSKMPRLTEAALYKKVSGFKDFAPVVRGFVDTAALAKMAHAIDKDTAKVIDELGLNGFKDLTFYYGFEGPALRSLVTLELPAPRKGLARFATAKPFTLEDLPSMPADMNGFTALRFDSLAVFDGVLEMVEKLMPPDEAPKVKLGLDQVNQALGINIRDDLLASLGSMVVTYSSQAEGPLFMGQTLMFQVKDAKKLQASIDKMVKSVAAASGKMELKQKDYHGVKLSQIYLHDRGTFVVPSYAISKDWLAIGLFPQPVQGYILRSGGELPTWKATAPIKASLDKLPNKYTMLSIEDPKPGMELLLSLAPVVAGAILADSGPRLEFDVSALPHAHTILPHLFTNVTVATDDGKTWKMESLSSVPLPLGLGRIDSPGLIGLAGITTMGRSAERVFRRVGEKVGE